MGHYTDGRHWNDETKAWELEDEHGTSASFSDELLAAKPEHGDYGGWCGTHETTGTWCSVCQQYTYQCCSDYGTCGCS